MRKNNISILIASFDKAYDIWNITSYYFDKYWQNIPYEVFLGANGEDKSEFVPKGWKYINVGKDISWSRSMLDYLAHIDTKYVLVYLDDLMLLEKVDENKLDRSIEFMGSKNAKMLRLSPNPKPDIKIDKFVGRISVEDRVPYITSLHAAIWEKEFLIKLLKYDFNPWDFETESGKTKEALANKNDFYATYVKVLNYVHFVEKGEFFPFIKEYAKKDNIKIDLKGREFYEEKNYFSLKSKIMEQVPNKYKNRIRKFFGKKEL